MSLRDRYMLFEKWLDPDKPGFTLLPNAPKEAADAFNEYRKIKDEAKKKGQMID